MTLCTNIPQIIAFKNSMLHKNARMCSNMSDSWFKWFPLWSRFWNIQHFALQSAQNIRNKHATLFCELGMKHLKLECLASPGSPPSLSLSTPSSFFTSSFSTSFFISCRFSYSRGLPNQYYGLMNVPKVAMSLVWSDRHRQCDDPINWFRKLIKDYPYPRLPGMFFCELIGWSLSGGK